MPVSSQGILGPSMRTYSTPICFNRRILASSVFCAIPRQILGLLELSAGGHETRASARVTGDRAAPPIACIILLRDSPDLMSQSSWFDILFPNTGCNSKKCESIFGRHGQARVNSPVVRDCEKLQPQMNTDEHQIRFICAHLCSSVVSFILLVGSAALWNSWRFYWPRIPRI